MQDPAQLLDRGDGLLHAAAVAATAPAAVLQVHFQPILDLARGVVAGYEALSRFAGPPNATPDRWFAAAHEAGLGDELEAQALDAALARRGSLPPDAFLTVNVGPRALCSAPVRAVLGRYADLRGVVVEITEQQEVSDYDELVAAAAGWRAAGAGIAVDDAGAGFSSLKHITALRPDLVKVDRGLVAGLDTDPARAAVIETLGIFASRLDAWLLAEGVETAGELERLLALGVPLAQGYLLGRPAPAMVAPAADAVDLCRRHAHRAADGELLGLTQEARVALVSATDGALAETLIAEPSVGWVVLIDEFERPISMVGRRTGARVRHPVLAVSAADRVTDVARRMLSRPEPDRLVPAALGDERGRLRGIITIERVLERLADLADGTAEPAATGLRAG